MPFSAWKQTTAIVALAFSVLHHRSPPDSPLFPYTTLFRSLADLPEQHHPLAQPGRHLLAYLVGVAGPGDQQPQPGPLRAEDGERGQQHGQALARSEEHTSELQSRRDLVCRSLLGNKQPPSLPLHSLSCITGAHRTRHSFPTRRSSDLSLTCPSNTTRSRSPGGTFSRTSSVSPGPAISSRSPGRCGPRTANAASSTDRPLRDRKSTRLNSSHVGISYAVLCLETNNRHRCPCILCPASPEPTGLATLSLHDALPISR